MDLLSHLAIGLLLSEVLSTNLRYSTLFASGSIFPDIDGLGNFFAIPMHRTLLHDPFLWVLILFLSRKRRLKSLKYFSLGALLHIVSDIPFGTIPLYPIPLSLGIYIDIIIRSNHIHIDWHMFTTSGIQGSYAKGYIVNQYGVSLFLIWLIWVTIRLLRNYKYNNTFNEHATP